MSHLNNEQTVNWLSDRKILRGAKDNRPLSFKTIGYCFHRSFFVFWKILGGQQGIRGGKSGLGGGTPAPESQVNLK